MPAPEAFQTRRGPPAGQLFIRPVSADLPSRFGPRHWGQSPVVWFEATAVAVRMAAVSVTTARPQDQARVTGYLPDRWMGEFTLRTGGTFRDGSDQVGS